MAALKKIINCILLYFILTFFSIWIGLKDESTGYYIFLLSSLFTVTFVVFTVWKESKPMKEIEYPAKLNVHSQNDLYMAIQNTLSGNLSLNQILARLRFLMLKRISRRLNISEREAETFLKEPEKLAELGLKETASVLCGKSSFSWTSKKAKTKILETILRELEEI